MMINQLALVIILFLVCHAVDSKIAIIMGGGSSAGKSTLKDYLTKLSPDAKEIDSDTDTTESEDWRSFNTAGELFDMMCADDIFHTNQGAISKFNTHVEEGKDFVYQGMLANYNGAIKTLKNPIEKDYEIYIVGIFRDIDQALVDNIARAESSKKWISLGFIIDSHKNFARTFPMLMFKFKNNPKIKFNLFKNIQNSSPVHVVKDGVIEDKELFSMFLSLRSLDAYKFTKEFKMVHPTEFLKYKEYDNKCNPVITLTGELSVDEESKQDVKEEAKPIRHVAISHSRILSRMSD
jgi:hypothetical protein